MRFGNKNLAGLLRANLLFAVAGLLLATSAKADITIDYTHDSFFASNATAKAALEAAVADINAVVDFSVLGAVDDHALGSGPSGSTVDFDFNYSYTNPATGGSESIADTSLAASEFKLFVGMRNLGGNTLGQGGPGGVGFGVSGSSVNTADFQAAVDDAVANDTHRRGSGPVISNITGTVGGANYSIDVGPTIGNLWFDQDTDNNGSADTSAELEAAWHFDHTSAVASGKDDFYTVALHEILHSIGFGIGDTWDSLHTGTTWLGAEGIAANGTGVGLIDGGGAHISSGTMSLTLADGTLQASVMTPSITTGTRKRLTELDLAILRDLGYSTIAVPEPSSLMFLALAGCVVSVRRRRSRTI